ncbi:50S ribosomal protein L17 [bacterium]|jgi:large subunit ribosomal protein L17|nr:50S ribosomal protein L17 [bacterium]MBT4122291.1 50S ribosomal protein L17 [bacterium]MBT4335682.1 50S ribosomal protein L17 [bacterium]MBT4495742.1 50S ribosomal protein L17 [bacterium]MBT4764146.1 50S ribosomal protein L17 [bacterium]
MRHRSKKKILDRKKAPRTALLNNLATQLIIYEKIKTTEAKAKTVKPIVEKYITRAKVDNVTNRRMLVSKLTLKKANKKIFEVIGPRYKDRNGGYTRIIKLGVRQGDGAKMAQIELV